MMAAGHSDKLPTIRFNDFYNIFTVQGGLLLFDIGYYIPLSEHFIKLARAREYAGTGTCPGALRALGKEVYGLPGDLASIGADGLISINHQIIPGSAARDVDSKGRPMPKPELTAGIIPAGQALTLSLHHQGSFDGRYFGLVSLHSLRQTRPVLTFKKRGQHGTGQGVSECSSRSSIPAA